MLQRLLKLVDYAGDYDRPGYGGITITLAERQFASGVLRHVRATWHRYYDTFELPEAAGHLLTDRLAISFSTDWKGIIASLAAPLEPLVKEVVFTRAAAGGFGLAPVPNGWRGGWHQGPAHLRRWGAQGRGQGRERAQPATLLLGWMLASPSRCHHWRLRSHGKRSHRRGRDHGVDRFGSGMRPQLASNSTTARFSVFRIAFAYTGGVMILVCITGLSCGSNCCPKLRMNSTRL